ncbi:fumarylacetoacetate hydrolase family protein [Saccharothrix algeriensis]|uniref:2-keto-4-pentenoate hydratase/2-oxohepta-3-ene-1,7-dioic acid hydratase in catechol pathway/regulator of RNase E activity RraA n=1 Tax=Saccharothrix algeriensis TaxID=173560 RepID=A0A8T8HZ77_9PSEU|nr:fumarylacetoacetate hydrolase family protein [Saccharothrix algeriensis]MBM7809396.1 2-keto-4-pentenoate hydratase/2-oxohepta-3-ene-1,7-dioic acid hydratase in catechol pathway/regulator of RNase E activity RraA [Saccharothrix algeriensis]QTR03738.1 fumarylacetoacetate hydrolase family protein [Saccharothrix algeriensis]
MTHPLGLAPTKIIAVHLNFRSRAAERGRFPEEPSYFLKPPSSLSWSGCDLVRPEGTELSAFEGEIAVVVGKRASRVAREDAADYIGGIAAANDFGVHDLRYADRGSNLRSKGADGYTPVGPVLLDPREVDLADLRLRTWVNGELVQDDNTGDLLFDFAYLIADLSRNVTLEPGDIILTGTPTGATVVSPGDVVEVAVNDTERLRNTVREAEPLAKPGARPKVTREDRAAAVGGSVPAIKPETEAALRSVSTATLSSQLRKRGLHHTFLTGLRPARPDLRMVGTAHTLRFLPLREDQFAERGGGMNAQKRAVESIGPGQVLVIDAREDHGAGTLGDILALRAVKRGAAGVVTDGCLRDSPAFAGIDLPAYSAGAHAAVLGRRHVPWEVGVDVACAGVLVRPGDVLVGDAEGVILIPPALVDEVAADAVAMEREERFILERVADGEHIDGLYPMGPAKRAEYERWSE